MESQSLACMEVWGGNEATFTGFEKPGVDIWLYSRPCKQDVSGGDVYYLSSCASGRITRMLLADVAGHGEAVADVASGLRNLMRRYINTIRPNKLFEEMNAGFAKLPSGDRFATSIVNSYFMPTSTLSVCTAGHPTPLIHRASTSRWQPVELPQSEHNSDDMPLGIAETSAYAQSDISMKFGDMVLCYTDGVIESMNVQGQQLGIDGLMKILNGLPADQPERIIPELVERITEEYGDGFHDDDVTLMLYRINNRATSLRDNLAAPLRWLASVITKA